MIVLLFFDSSKNNQTKRIMAFSMDKIIVYSFAVYTKEMIANIISLYVIQNVDIFFVDT